MKWLIDNWYLLIIAAVVLTVIIAGVIAFIKLPTNKKIANMKEWLKWAVVEAEKALGSGTGQLKLRMVYDMAISKFDWIKNIIPFEVFSKWVDDALEWMRIQLENNNAVKTMVEDKEA